MWGKIQREKKVKRKQYNLPYDIKAVGKNIKGGRGEGDGNLGKKIKIQKRVGVGEKYKIEGNFIHSWFAGRAGDPAHAAGPGRPS